MFEVYAEQSGKRGKPQQALSVSWRDLQNNAHNMSDAELQATYFAQVDSDNQWAFEEIWRRYYKLIHHLAHKLGGTMAKAGGDYNDLFSAGQEGLIGALGKFDPERGTKFTTFAGIYIWQKMVQSLRDGAGRMRYGEKPQSQRQTPISLELPVQLRNDSVVTLGEMLESFGDEDCNYAETLAAISDVMKKPEHVRYAAILRLRIQGYRQKEIATMIGVSQAQVSRVLRFFARDVYQELYG